MVVKEDNKKYLELKEDIEKLMRRVSRDFEDEDFKVKFINRLLQLREALIGK